jgi:predicted AAA+ superfamily ATPase
MKMTLSHDLLRLKLAESMAVSLPSFSRREVSLPGIQGKAFAVIGVRRGGKTTFLSQCKADRLAQKRPADSQLLISLEDERLHGMSASDLAWLLEEHSRQFSGLRQKGLVTYYLDEIQVVPGWERLVRRLMDAGGVEIFISGSSARLLSREVATSLRGRAMEVLIHPFSFREALRHAGIEPGKPYPRLKPLERAFLDNRLQAYLAEGGFPEAQGVPARDRFSLLNGYVDVVVLRDIIDRHQVSNPLALRWIQRHLLANPGGLFSVQKHFDTLRSQGIPVGKDTLHHYLAHLEDTFLLRTVSMHCSSERQRMINPRKAYPVDPGLIALFERTGRTHHGRALETAVLIEQERRGWENSYLRLQGEWEVDFFSHRPGEKPMLIQVCLESEADQTWDREVRSLESATEKFPEAAAFLITLDATPPTKQLPEKITWVPAARWLLGDI